MIVPYFFFFFLQEEHECPEYFYRHVDYHSWNDSVREKGSLVCLWNGM